jgi:two-component system, OmpR family, phosphate regulon sensor histidine kinase PhoR
VKKQTSIFFYVLAAYVVLQFIWWGFHLIQLSQELADSQDQSQRRVMMIVGEGSVFFLILLFGLWKVRASIQKDIALSQRQNNFLLSVTHELKTPLASNKLYLQTLLKRRELPQDKQEELLNSALLENKRLEGMIENILTAARLESHNMIVNKEAMNLSERLTKIVQQWSKERAEVKLGIQPDIQAKIDPMILEVVVLNLLENAIKYSPKNSDCAIEVGLEKQESNIILSVKDQGVGVPESYRRSIFEKFFRVGSEETRSQKGSGLGLYIVAQLLSMHDATIECLPNSPKGAHFKITFKHVN